MTTTSPSEPASTFAASRSRCELADEAQTIRTPVEVLPDRREAGLGHAAFEVIEDLHVVEAGHGV